ncbi:MAG: amidophosphoribosyltransferase [Candidatus Vogelbacteria bacterium]|nr:amidophosphoribosyltransferase [Candidatus Vogelbacteria bacterium]
MASETCALDTIGARFVRQVDRGEMVIISRRGIESRRPFARLPGRFCVFEHIYFGRPDSVWDKRTNYAVRKQIGRQLARECPAQADIVVPVPDSGVHGAMGYALKSGLPFELGLTRSHYIGRTFIDPSQVTREEMMRLKFNAIRSEVAGKRVALIDDSVVRGTTSIKVVKMLRKAGAREVHLRSTAPPYYFPCFLGIDTPKQEDLLAYRFKGDLDKMAKHLGVDSLGYISIPGLYQAIQRVPGDPDELALCAGCFSGEYPKYD